MKSKFNIKHVSLYVEGLLSARNLSKEVFAEKIGCSKSHFVRALKNNNNVSFKFYQGIAHELGFSIQEFFERATIFYNYIHSKPDTIKIENDITTKEIGDYTLHLIQINKINKRKFLKKIGLRDSEFNSFINGKTKSSFKHYNSVASGFDLQLPDFLRQALDFRDELE